MFSHGMDLTLIPPDPDAEICEITAVGSAENTDGTWGFRVNTKSTSGAAISELVDQCDVVGWDAVASRRDDVIVAGEIIDLTKSNRKYVLQIRPDEKQPNFASTAPAVSPGP